MAASEPTQIIPSVTFVYSDDAVSTWYNRAGTAPTLVTGNSYRLDLSAFNGGTTSNPDTRLKLLYHFNLYQRFRIKEVIKEWHPRWNKPDMQAFAYTTNLSAAIETEPEWLEMQCMASFFQNSHYMTWIEDEDDYTQRFTLNEYWQVRTHPRARTWRVCDNHTFSYVPGTFNVTQTPVNGFIGAMGNTSLQQMQLQNTNLSYAATDPMNMPWQPTKAYNIVAGSPVYGFNLNNNQYLGGKLYYYTPNNQPMADAAAIEAEVGFFTTRIIFEFMDPEFRALVVAPTFTPSLQRVDEDSLLIVENLQNQNTIPRYDQNVEFVGNGQTTEDINREKVTSINRNANARAERAATNKKLKQQEAAMA